MGKKDKNKKKGKGAEKTLAKTEKKLTAKQKRELAAKGENDIELIVAEIEKEEQKRQRVVEKAITPPSRRSNFTFIPHPDKEELILFGGEFYNGLTTITYNDLFFYNISKNEWTIVKAPGGPPPRSGHQMVSTSLNKGQLWLFGGEFTSTSQSQFYHYRDFWVFHLSTKKWEKINEPGGPNSRSGHRMLLSKKQIFIFGGFHDNLREFKYFNDVHCFNLETYKWTKIEPLGIAPSPRSSCSLTATTDGKLLIWGGYSKQKIKKDVDKGQIHSDMFMLSLDKHDTTGTKFKWQQVKQGGVKISPRCSTTTCLAPNNKAYIFGGVFDKEEDEENLSGEFYNDLFCLDLEKISWNKVNLRKIEKPKQDIEDDSTIKIDNLVENMELDEVKKISDDGVFTVTIGPSSSINPAANINESNEIKKKFVPSPRMNPGLSIKHGVLYLYGGMVEEKDKQYTLSDFYSLDLHKLDEWKIIIKDDISKQEWFESESESSGDENSESESESEDDEDSNDDEESDINEKMET